MFRRGDISFFLHPGQQKLYDWLNEKDRDVSVICTSRQYGKTTLLLAYAIAYCVTHPKSHVLFMAPTSNQIERVVQQKLPIITQFLPPDLLPKRVGLTRSFANGATLTISGMNVGQGAKARGDSADLIIVDECRDVMHLKTAIESSFQPMLQTTDGKLVLISTPPDSRLHPFTDYYIREAIANDNFYKMTFLDNPMVTAKTLRNSIRRYTNGMDNPIFRREYMADYEVSDPSKLVMREWDETANDEWFSLYKGPGNQPVRMYTGLDYGYADPCGLIFGYYDSYEGALVIEYEFAKRQMSTDEVGQQVLAGEKQVRLQKDPYQINPYDQPIRIMDISPNIMADLHNHFNLRFEPCPKIPNQMAMLNRLRTAFNEGKIRIHPRCKQLRFQLTAGTFDNSGRNYARTEEGGHLDLVDALKYLNLGARWHEIPRVAAPTVDIRNLPPGQMYVGGPFSKNVSFQGGVRNRPT